MSGDIATCPFARATLATPDVPTFAGGTCDCPGGCIPGTPNDSTEKKGSK